MEQYLKETETLNYSNPVVQEIIDKLDLSGKSDVEKARTLFYYVRDSISYSIKGMSIRPDYFKASNVLQLDRSYCIPKALALATLGRAVGIPTRIHMVDFINHRLSKELEEIWGTNVMAPHSYTEMYLDGKWVKLTPALDKQTCDKHEFITPEFEEGQDVLLSPVDRNGNPHVEYIRDHGTFDDLPINKILKVLQDVYGDLANGMLEDMFGEDLETFE